VVGQSIARAARPPKVWLQSATATLYAHRYDVPNDEATGIIGGDEPDVPETWRFSIEVAKAWEQAVNNFELPQTRKVILRSAMVMSPEPGGVFDVLLGLVRKGLGGRSGDGRQFVSWIHEGDFINAIRWLIDREDIAGAVNLASPNPLPNAEFMKDLRDAWGTRIGLPATEWMLEIGAIFLKTETELILKSRRVIPGRLLQGGFRFRLPGWKEAARDLCERWKQIQRTESRAVASQD
jgi:uncharacterized protein (TIGR01777 family)